MKNDSMILYENEILSLTPIELKILSYIRIISNNNMYWNSSKSLESTLNIKHDSIKAALNSLNRNGCIITFDIKTNNSILKQQAFYITNYNSSNNNYYISETIDQIKLKLEKCLQLKEIEFAVRNKKQARKITVQQHEISKNIIMTKNDKETNLSNIVEYINQVYDITIKDTEANSIYDDIVFMNGGKYNQNLLEQKVNIVHDYTLHNEVDNIVGCIRTAINQDWHNYKCNTKIKAKDEQYTASELEKNLLQDWQIGC